MTALLIVLALLSVGGIARTMLDWSRDPRPLHLPPPGSRCSAEPESTP